MQALQKIASNWLIDTSMRRDLMLWIIYKRTLKIACWQMDLPVNKINNVIVQSKSYSNQQNGVTQSRTGKKSI